MPEWMVAVWILAGFLLGLLAGRMWAGWRDGSLSSWRERLEGKEQQLQELRRQLLFLQERADLLQDSLRRETERRAGAEEKAARLAPLEEELGQRQARLEALHRENTTLSAQISRLQTQLEEERRGLQEKMELLQDAQRKLSDAFKALSSEALQHNNRSFLELAKTTLERFQAEARGDLSERQKAIESLIQPIQESLTRFDQHVQEMEKQRREAYGSIQAQVRAMLQSQEKLQAETENLVRALRTPAVRGRWGEIQLKRVVEIAGMLPHCDFLEQATPGGDSQLRPDLIVRLPGDKQVVVDAKAPLQAYLDAMEAEEGEARQAFLRAHARQIREHIHRLSSKAYWDQFDSTPEFVVMFLPGECFFSDALSQDPSLIEEGVTQRVLLATPTTLIALLRAVAYGWRQEKVAQNAQAISDLGRELHHRLSALVSHIEGLGKNLDRAVGSYNKMVGSLEARVLTSARKFTALGVPARKELPFLRPVEKVPRALQPPDEEDSSPLAQGA